MSKETVKTPQKPEDRQLVVQRELDKVSRMIVHALPAFMKEADPRGVRFAQIGLHLSREMQNIEPAEIAKGVLRAALIGLEPDPIYGQLYLIPYGKVLQPIIGYRGVVELARRSGEIANVTANPVYKGDDFHVEFGTSQRLRHVPSLEIDNRGKRPMAAYAIAEFKAGNGHQFKVLPLWAIEERMQRSQAVRYAASKNENLQPGQNATKTPWDTDFGSMAAKSAVRALAPMLPTCKQLIRALGLEDKFEDRAESEDAINVTYEEIVDGSEPPSAPKNLNPSEFTDEELQALVERWQHLKLNKARLVASIGIFPGTKQAYIEACNRKNEEEGKKANA